MNKKRSEIMMEELLENNSREIKNLKAASSSIDFADLVASKLGEINGAIVAKPYVMIYHWSDITAAEISISVTLGKRIGFTDLRGVLHFVNKQEDFTFSKVKTDDDSRTWVWFIKNTNELKTVFSITALVRTITKEEADAAFNKDLPKCVRVITGYKTVTTAEPLYEFRCEDSKESLQEAGELTKKNDTPSS